MPVDNENPSTYRVIPVCGCHVKKVIRTVAAIRVLISTAICFVLMYNEDLIVAGPWILADGLRPKLRHYGFYLISSTALALILWQSAIAATFAYGVYKHNKFAIFTYAYLEIAAIVFHSATHNMVAYDQGFPLIVMIIYLTFSLAFSIFYFWGIIRLYIRYLTNLHFFDNPPVIFVDKDELIPMSNTIKSRS
ncbi:hypothetical protein PENTCL1PPCAC_6034 [Pristionchus entomophagus]|uniref:G protein-coupled receptor n=1 Tax=Pristionchus entomophagus TaxID=358040 RepID=A0AAV5SUH9_9BILA|nr:hypothetical protein PENTCL1PPCAC_6034 [Pristionchus entomophagus]